MRARWQRAATDHLRARPFVLRLRKKYRTLGAHEAHRSKIALTWDSASTVSASPWPLEVREMSKLLDPESRSSNTPITIAAGRFFFANRFLFGLLFALAIACLAHPHLSWSVGETVKPLSVVLVLLGIGLRALAGGCAGRHTRTANIEGPSLATGGPYAFVRNPIYLGSMVLGLGIVGLVGSWVMLIPYGVVFALFYFCVIPAEEQFLLQTFGDQYRQYCDNVPRFFPRFRPWSKAGRVRFDWKPALGEWRVALAIVGILLFFAVSSLIWQ
jgi:protein-S-isoprenylcysteine O-methyltransferase Ste14